MGEESQRNNPAQYEVEILHASSSDAFRMTRHGTRVLGRLLQVGEDFGGVAFGFDGIPDLFDFAVGADQEAAADDSLEQATHEFLAAPRAVGLNHLVRGIAEQREIQFVFVAEVLQGLHGVGAGSKNGDAELVELLFCVTKLGRFDRSTGGIRFRKKEKKDAAALEIS
jgi:hypothetical protein